MDDMHSGEFFKYTSSIYPQKKKKKTLLLQPGLTDVYYFYLFKD